MRFAEKKSIYSLRFILTLLPVIMLMLLSQKMMSQEPPPRPITVTVTGQSLSFGAFTHGTIGGTVTVSSGGLRSSTGDVILLNLGYSFSSALYEVVANPGTVVSLLNGPDVTLPGSNGGSLTLHIGNSDPVSPFVTNAVPPTATLLNVGGSLTVSNPAANPPGNYSGTFNITFIQE
jgi:hypothetical protein